MNMRQAILAALRGDPTLVPKVTQTLRHKIHEEDGPMVSVVNAATALEPIIEEALRKRPSRLRKYGLKSAHMLASLAAEDSESQSRLAQIATGRHLGIVFVDVAGFTEFTAENGDEAAIKLLGQLQTMVDRSIKPVRGQCVKRLGDGFLLAFPTASQAVRGAASLRDAVIQKRQKDPEFPVRLRTAVHAGEPLVEQDDLLGHDVNLTARLLDHCAPDEVVISDAAKELSERRLKKIVFGDRRVVKIRGLSTPVAVYSVIPAATIEKLSDPAARTSLSSQPHERAL
jgi:class 3 adenylate cyclase